MTNRPRDSLRLGIAHSSGSFAASCSYALWRSTSEMTAMPSTIARCAPAASLERRRGSGELAFGDAVPPGLDFSGAAAAAPAARPRRVHDERRMRSVFASAAQEKRDHPGPDEEQQTQAREDQPAATCGLRPSALAFNSGSAASTASVTGTTNCCWPLP